MALEEDDEKILENVRKRIEEIAQMDRPPQKLDSKICNKCSYFDLCYV